MKLKIILAIALTMFTIFMSYVFVGGFIQKQLKEDSASNIKTPSPSSVNQSTPPVGPADVYTLTEVASHNKSDDCWIIINQKVYDVGKFLSEHPGGASTILPYCGKEATKAFDTQDRGSGSSHSTNANNMLADYLVGSIR
jgi:cytochrome b involved in lipid metabolism